jgi:hypothetical protein
MPTVMLLLTTNVEGIVVRHGVFSLLQPRYFPVKTRSSRVIGS